MQRLQTLISWAIVVSEASHVFCCVIPSIVSVLSLMAGLGLTIMPAGLMEYHDFMHEYEMPVIIASGVILVLGWGLHALSLRLDCRSTGCAHEPCKPKKFRATKILWVATALFTVNLIVYFTLHYKG